MKRAGIGIIVLGLLSLLPTAAAAQGASIAGLVTDTSGAIIPGVGVEVTSPALIEQGRTAVTDGQGRYNIPDLRPGVYVVTFTLTGFSTVRREGIELSVNFTATVNAEMRLGAVEETVTVSGASPVVDLQSTAARNVVSQQLLDSVPTNKSLGAWAALTPGMVAPATAQDVGGSRGEQSIRLSIHGSFASEQRVLIDGMEITGSGGQGSAWGFMPNPASTQEVSLELGGGGAEATVGGVQINFIPKDGGNIFSGHFFTTYANSGFQGTNVSDEVAARGLDATSISALHKMWDVNAAAGGPVVRGRLWFYSGHRHWGNTNTVAGVFHNATPDSWFYTRDLSRPGFEDYKQRSHNLRLTWQVSPRNKIRAFFEIQDNCDCHRNIVGGNTAPEATHLRWYKPPNNVPQASWTFLASSRLLVETGASARIFSYTNRPQAGVSKDTISVLEQSTNIRYRAPQEYGGQLHSQINERVAVSYVTGSHAFKTGMYLRHAWSSSFLTKFGGSEINYQFRNQVPVSVQVVASPLYTDARVKGNLGLYAQDQWTVDRLTLNLGLRYDYVNAFVPAKDLAAGPYIPARSFQQVDCVPCWHDLSPRLSAAYDLFGTGRTALKVSLGKYVRGEDGGVATANDPVSTTIQRATRAWADANGDFVPQEHELGPLSDARFGQVVATTQWSPDLLSAYGVRPVSWQGSVGVQQELRSNVALNVAYYRTSWDNFQITDNRAVTPLDYDPYCITAPADGRLPGGGNQQICGLYDIKPNKFGQVDNLVTMGSDFGRQTDIYNGVDATVNARLPRGALVAGGLSTGRSATDSCFVVDSPDLRFCNVTPPFQTQIKLNGMYPLPWDLQLGAAWQSLPGIPITASYVATNAQIAPSLGRSLAGGLSTVTIPLLDPQSEFEGRINQLDVRLSKLFRLGGARIQGNFDLYNVLNASPILAMNTRFGPAWLTPTAILEARLARFSIQMDF